ncbi:MAG: signal peptidase II [Maricaulaceae bacterium]
MSALGFSARAGFGGTLIGLVLIADQSSKIWVFSGLGLDRRGHIDLSPVFDLTLVWNRGVSFGLFQADGVWGRYGLAAFSVAVAVALGVWLVRANRMLTVLALGLIIGGAVGNVIDRVRFGAVLDFLDFSGLYFPWVFNVADAAITCGVAILALDLWLAERAERENAAAAE